MFEDDRFVLSLSEAQGCLSVCQAVFLDQNVEMLKSIGLYVGNKEQFYTELGDLVSYLNLTVGSLFERIEIPTHHRSSYLASVYIAFPEIRESLRLALGLREPPKGETDD